MSKRGDERFTARLSNDGDKGPMPGTGEIFVPDRNSPVPSRDNKFRAENEELKGQLAQLQEMLAARASGLALQGGSLMVEGFQFSPTGLIAPEGFTAESWEQIGHLLFRLEGSIQWLIGDWLNYGDGVKWGDATKFAETFGRDPGTLHNYAFVSREIQFSFRNEKVSHTHHVVVANAKLTPEQQQYALSQAVEQRMTVSKFRQWIKEQKGDVVELQAGGQPDVDGGYKRAPLNIAIAAQEMEKFWQRDPATAKRQDRERLRQLIAEHRRAMDELERQWGIE